MSTRREFLEQTAAAGILMAASNRAARAAGDTATGSKKAVKLTNGPRIKSVVRREETVLRYGGNGDNWHMSWAAVNWQYVSLVTAGAGLENGKRGTTAVSLPSVEAHAVQPSITSQATRS